MEFLVFEEIIYFDLEFFFVRKNFNQKNLSTKTV